MASSLNNDVSMDALPTDENYKPNTVSLRGNREQHLPQANGVENDDTTPKCVVQENHSSEAAESAILNEYLAIDQSNNPSGPSSFAEYLERSSDTSVVGDCYPSRETPSEEGTSHQRQKSKRTEDEDDKIHRFFLELTASCGLKWTTFLAELGYNPKELFHLSVEKMDNHFRHYLAFWLETVTSLGQNPITYLYNALSLERHHELVDKFKDQFNIKYSPCSPPRHEFVLLKENLLKIPSQKEGKITSLNRKEEIMHVEKEIWSNLTDNELEQIKAYLHNTKKEKFGKRVLYEIKTSLDLFRKLHETCLVNEDSFEFLIKILKFVGRNDLIQKIMALETPYCRFEKEGKITSLNRKEEIMHVEKEIWSNLTDNELEQIKAYLHNTKKEKFGKRVLYEIKTSLDLFRKLHETCLVNEDSFEFLIKILKFVGRNDLIQKIMALETPYCRFEKDDVVPTEIKLMADKRSIDLYLKLLQSGSEKKRDIRLVVVGKKGAGKTSLIRRLFGEEIADVTSTNGIEIHKIKCKAMSDDGIWNKLDENYEETQTHVRLFKEYVGKLQDKRTYQKQVESHIAINTPTTSFDESRKSDTVSMQPEITKPLKAAEHPVTLQQSNQSSEQAARDFETMLTAKSQVDVNDKEEYATFLLWDFAGDEEFYHTHQTFLSQDAMYLVVTKLNEADDPNSQEYLIFSKDKSFNQTKDTLGRWVKIVLQMAGVDITIYKPHSTRSASKSAAIRCATSVDTILKAAALFRLWIDSIHCYSRLEEGNVISDGNKTTSGDLDPPIVIVGTWKDAVTSEAETVEEAYKENLLKYTNDLADDERGHLRCEYFISNKDDECIAFQEIRQNILNLARGMRTWNIKYPLKFIQLEQRLQEKKKDLPIISYQKIKDYSSDIPEPLSEEELILFLEFHHELRALVYFKDLSEYIILDTQWLSDAFRCIVTAQKFRINIRNQKEWNDFFQRGKLNNAVLEDIFENETKILFEHKDFILKVMEKFDIIIHPNKSEDDDENPCYYVPCMIKEECKCDIYEMFKVPEDTRHRSTWLCFKFRFLPPHLKNHLIASLSRRYTIAQVGISNQKEMQIAIFRNIVVFELQKTKLRKLLVTTCPNAIQIQVLEFGKGIERGLLKDIAHFVEMELEKIIHTRFNMSNVKFEKKWECGHTKPEFVTGINDFGGEQMTEYYCETCKKTHKFMDEWSGLQTKSLCLPHCPKDAEHSNPHLETPSEKPRISMKVRCSFQAGMQAFSDVTEEPTRTGSLTGFSKEEINFAKMGMIVLNILADVLYDLLRPDKPYLPPRSDCDITYLYNAHRNLNKNIPSNRWGGTWQNILDTDTAIGDDIERIRLTRNDIQHSTTFTLDDIRFNKLYVIVADLVKRFDSHNKPARLYTAQLKEIMAKTVSEEEAKCIKHQLKSESKLKMAIDIEMEQQ